MICSFILNNQVSFNSLLAILLFILHNIRQLNSACKKKFIFVFHILFLPGAELAPSSSSKALIAVLSDRLCFDKSESIKSWSS